MPCVRYSQSELPVVRTVPRSRKRRCAACGFAERFSSPCAYYCPVVSAAPLLCAGIVGYRALQDLKADRINGTGVLVVE